MKRADLVVVPASNQWHHGGEVSVRGPKGRGADDPAQPHITAAGFKAGERVALVLADELDALIQAAAGTP